MFLLNGLFESVQSKAAHTQSAKVNTCYTLWHFEVLGSGH